MKNAAWDLEFELAAILRDEINEILKEIKKKGKDGAEKGEKVGTHGRSGKIRYYYIYDPKLSVPELVVDGFISIIHGDVVVYL